MKDVVTRESQPVWGPGKASLEEELFNLRAEQMDNEYQLGEDEIEQRVLQEEGRVLRRHYEKMRHDFADRKRGRGKRDGCQGGQRLDHADPCRQWPSVGS